jgi:leucyl aminopeptidase (aminopeptidase T)
MQREQDIENLESASHSLDPFEQTDMATMQRINQAMLLQLRQQQENNQLQQAITLQQIVAQKQQQDAMKASSQDAADYQNNYQTNIAPINQGAAQALTY